MSRKAFMCVLIGTFALISTSALARNDQRNARPRPSTHRPARNDRSHDRVRQRTFTRDRRPGIRPRPGVRPERYWRVHRFSPADFHAWRGGYWHHGWYGDRLGWWWIVNGIWFYYAAPIYPYPNPYVPGSVVVIQPEQPTPAPPPTEAPTPYWYHCTSPEGYYPYVTECPGGWTKVPATPPPPPATSQPENPPPQTH